MNVAHTCTVHVCKAMRPFKCIIIVQHKDRTLFLEFYNAAVKITSAKCFKHDTRLISYDGNPLTGSTSSRWHPIWSTTVMLVHWDRMTLETSGVNSATGIEKFRYAWPTCEIRSTYREHKNSNQKSVFTSGYLAHFCFSTRMPILWFVHPWFKTRYINSHQSHDSLTARGTINVRQQGLHNNVLWRWQDHKPRKAKTQLTSSQDVILNFQPQEK